MSRAELLLNTGWLFALGDTISSTAQAVCLPHSVCLSPAISSGCRNYQGKCCYKKTLFIDGECKDKKLVVEFEGAMGVTQLYVNNVPVYTHFCGYTPLVADITEYVRCGEDNELFLILDNSDNEEVPPGKSQGELDFTYEGGLYREAKLIITQRVHITHCLLENETAGGGVFISCTNVSTDSARVNVKVHVRNEYAHIFEGELELCLEAKADATVAKATLPVKLAGATAEYIETELTVASPHLWSPDSPYLYTINIRLRSGTAVADEIKQAVGIRTFELTADRGLIFNGVPMRISGGNYHQTYPYIGNGVPSHLLRRDAMKLRELGLRSIRTHYPLGHAFTDACNELGITLIVSNPGWQWYKEGIFATRSLYNLRQTVRWQRNNPAVMLWEPVLNETQMPEWFLQKIHDIVHEEYPYSPCYTAADHGPMDVAYREQVAGAQRPKPRWIREYNDSPDNWTDHNCAWRVPRGWGDYPMVRSVERMLGLDAQCTDNNYINVYNKPNICGYNIWPAIEHNRGYHINPCWGGHLDMFRLPKFSYYFAKSQMDAEECGPVLFIANWWTELSPDDVTVYSNADTVRLYHDGQLIEEQRPQKLAVKHPPFVFAKVHTRCKKRDRSTLMAQALIDGKVVATATVRSPGVPTRLKLEADLMGIPLLADGSDMVMVYCKLLDIDGNIVPMTGDRHPILFTVSGEGTVVGDSSIGANPICAEAGIAAVLVKATEITGKITVNARMLWPQNNPRIAIAEDTIELASI